MHDIVPGDVFWRQTSSCMSMQSFCCPSAGYATALTLKLRMSEQVCCDVAGFLLGEGAASVNW